jgi:RNA polymerase sigma-70 factor (ECF subfamily)
VTPAGPSAPRRSPARDKAFAELALPHLEYVTRVARALTRDESDAEDLVQETFLRAYRYWDSFQPGTDCRRWLAQICRNVMVDSQRRARLEDAVDDAELESLAAVQMHQAALAAGLGDMYTRLDLGPAILDAIARLEPIFRDVIVLSDIEELPYDEIAKQLEIPLGTVRSRLYRGRRHLQEQLLVYALDAGLASRDKQ